MTDDLRALIEAVNRALQRNAAILQTAARYQTPVREWTCFFIDGENVTVKAALDEADAALAALRAKLEEG
jgi:hypothetical protein